MAELHVQPKKASNWWLWLLLAAIAVAVIFFLARGCDTANTVGAVNNNSDSTGSGPVATTSKDGNIGASSNAIDFNSPAVTYDEVTDKDISVRGTDQYSIYSLGDNILFDIDKSTIRSEAETKLTQIASSLTKRFPDGNIEIYGRADATGDAAHNKQLSQERAEAVKNWIVKNGQLKEDRISMHAEGETSPIAPNNTEEGKQENRSVQIVARQR